MVATFWAFIFLSDLLQEFIKVRWVSAILQELTHPCNSKVFLKMLILDSLYTLTASSYECLHIWFHLIFADCHGSKLIAAGVLVRYYLLPIALSTGLRHQWMTRLQKFHIMQLVFHVCEAFVVLWLLDQRLDVGIFFQNGGNAYLAAILRYIDMVDRSVLMIRFQRNQCLLLFGFLWVPGAHRSISIWSARHRVKFDLRRHNMVLNWLSWWRRCLMSFSTSSS